MPESAGDERSPLARAVRTAGEAVLMLLGFATVWPFASVEPFWEAVATGGIALLSGLWALHAGLTRHWRLRFDGPALILCGLILLSGLQLIPLPRGVVRFVAPSTLHWYEAMIPATAELLPGESGAVARPTAFPISLDPSATRLFACRIFGLLVVYLAARNWLASRESFRRLAGVALLNGVALAAFALVQYFSSAPTEIYWSVPTSGKVFGPFVCRNHYPDYLALCAGLAIGLLMTKRTPPVRRATLDSPPGSFWDEVRDSMTAPLQLLQEPGRLTAAAAVGLMLVSIPFSLSRGGILSFLAATLGVFVLARWSRGRTSPGVYRTAITTAAAVALGVVAWFGWAPIEARFDEIGTGRSIDDRIPLWNASLKQLPGFWLAGAGNGTHLRIEPLGRDATALHSVVEHAHNEYLEAAIEGGILRLGLTVALPGIVLFSLARGYRQLHARSAGPLILGAGFGLAVVAAHAVTDFALHLPAIALLAIIVTAFAMAAANDPDFQPTRQRRDAEPMKPRTGWPAVAIGCSIFSLMALLTWEARQRYLGDKYLAAGMSQPRSTHPETARRRIAWLEAGVAADPHNPDAFFQLAQAHLDAANDLGPTPAEAVAGPVLPRRARPERYSPAQVDGHILPALRALRTARDLCPLVAEVHARLGLLAGYFAQSEPALVHLERAKLILKTDPEIWYACGVEAAKAGDRAGAVGQWKRSLELSPRQLRPILRAARQTLSSEEILRTLLPDDPVILLGAADELYPARQSERRPFVERAADGPTNSVPQSVAVATACAELDRIADARRAWARAIELDPDRVASHEGLSRLLEAEELYAEALPQLEWLLAHRPPDAELRLRHRAAVHGAKLQRQIGE